ncbi:MAG: glucans biosynthesis glucosyltransferase MdoH [Pseudomonadota bacterium]
MNQKQIKRPWQRAARSRRILILFLISVTSVLASTYMADILPNRGATRLEFGIVIVFTALFAWISIGFWEALVGLFTLACRYDRFAITKTGDENTPQLKTDARTAVIIPICNEKVDRVFGGLRTIATSLEQTGEMKHFDFFVLSDSSDPDIIIEEEIAWAELCQSVGGFNRIFFRHRLVNLKRKSGNIADFCRRWGRRYRYMVVLDADSIMSGSSLVRLVHLMERNPNVGIIQTAPLAVNRETLIARIQQFANHAYGPLFVAGLNFLQLGDSHFWGHNAIIRIAPFMEHCSLPKLSGRPPHGGFILSHDFVEAAFMRRGGWEVWLAYDMEGSYEEVPPTLLEELKRDRRWCQGNLQHIRLLFTKGLFSAHRALFLHGAFSYTSALLWATFISLSSVEAILETFRSPIFFPSKYTLFPNWPVWQPRWALTLLAVTAVILFIPKLFSVILIILKKGKVRLYGGFLRLLFSLVTEVLFSALFAPIRMLFHCKFVFMTLVGAQIGWGPQQRSDQGTGWFEALRFHGTGMIIALIWGTALFLFNRSFFWWNAPIFIPLLLAVPLSVWSSRASVGRAFQRLGLFRIPEEVSRPPELDLLHNTLKEQERSGASLPMGNNEGFMRAVVDPRVNSLHSALIRKERKLSLALARRRQDLREKALTQGPEGLDKKEKRDLLFDPTSMRQLHKRVWETSDPAVAERWGISP